MHLSTGLRQRKYASQPSELKSVNPIVNNLEKCYLNECITVFYYIFVFGLMFLSGIAYSKYIKLLHENSLWFSKLDVSMLANLYSQLINFQSQILYFKIF